MHSNSGMVGKQLYSPQEMQQLHPGDEEAWRRIDSADGEPVLEIYRQFQPCLLLDVLDAPYAAVCRDTTSNFHRFRRQ